MLNIGLYIIGKKSRNHIRYLGRGAYQFYVSDRASLPLSPKRKCRISDENCILSFEYKASGPIWNTEIIIAKKKKCEYRNIHATDSWRQASIDISAHFQTLQNIIYLSQETLLLDFIGLPVSAPVCFYIRRIHFRRRNEFEEKAYLKLNEHRCRIRHCLPNPYGISFPCEIHSVRCNTSTIEITGKVPMNETAYYLHEIPAGAIFSPKGSKECAPIVLNHNNELFTAVIPRFENHGDTSYDRIYSRYIIVAEFLGERAFASSAKYATYISTKWSIPVILPRNKKGLGDFRAGLFDTDLDDLGISFITINIKINDFLCASPRKGNTAFHYGCKLYYINTSCIEQYDAAILEAYKRNIIVSAVVLVNTAIHSFDPEIGAILQHPEYEPAGHYSMPDTTTPESVQVYLAALNYLAERYTRADGRYGHIHRWIVHNEIDAGWIWCNAGKKTMNQYAEEYLRSLRLVWLTMKKYDSNAKVFIPLTHNWNISFSENCFPASKMLESIHTISQAEGDFDWGIALHSYPQLLWDPRSWRDNLAYNDLTTTPLITFKNIEIIDQWIHSKELLFQGKPRVLMLTEQNPNSVDYSEREQMMQAVSLCYIWQKIKSIDSIEAYIAHCWIDNHTEGGLKTGLRKYPNDLEDPCGKKDSWYAYKDFGTEKEIAILELSGEIIKRDYDQ